MSMVHSDEAIPKEQKTEENKKEEPPKIGNFSLPGSQQPTPLFGFNGNIIDPGEVQLFFFNDQFIGKERVASDMIPGVLFGVSENCSLFFHIPFTSIYRDQNYRSSGWLDAYIEGTYAFYNRSTSTYQDQAVLIGNITVPTGSSKKMPPTGFGASSFFMGASYSHMMVDWCAFVSSAAILMTSRDGVRFGDQFLYQFGIGRNIPSPKGWIYAWMFEIDGQYAKRNKVDRGLDPNSGGNVIYATPSLWISSRELTLQVGISLPINQNLFGNQRRFDYAFNLNIGWSFY
jgi:hypothetical protein